MERTDSWIQRNLFIVLGVSLPVVLILLVLSVQFFQRLGIEPPNTPVLYVHSADWSVRQHLRANVVDGRLRLELATEDENQRSRLENNGSLELAIYEPASDQVEVIPIEIGAAPEAADWMLDVPTALDGLILDDALRSPEGARLVIKHRSGGLFGELLGFGRSSARYRLDVDGVGFDVPGHPVRYSSKPGFIAWVVGP